MYRVLIVDDEPSSIRYIRTLISKYMPEYQVVREAFSGKEAHDYLLECPVDLLITDARMPGMDGIELARRARKMSSALKIVVVSGYADFEYAKGALAAGVNEYLLKPLNIERTLEVFRGIAEKLDEEYIAQRHAALAHLVAGERLAEAEMIRLFGGVRCQVGLLRIGNLPTVRGAKMRARPLIEDGALAILPGRDDMELLGVAMAGQGAQLVRRLLEVSQTHRSGECETVVYAPREYPLAMLPDLVKQLTQTMDEHLVIGRSQQLELGTPPRGPYPALGASELRKLDFCLQSRNLTLLKDMLFNWAVDWEERSFAQRALESLLWQIADRALGSMPQQQAKRQQVRDEVDELFLYARNTGDLMSGLWDVLFAPLQASHGRQQAEELGVEIREYVKEHCAEPLTIQLVCVQFGISQTYLSRLFRKFMGATFNEYLTGCRLDAAKRLIREQPDAKLRDVALLCGYEDPSYFSKVFRQREGMTPQQFAAQHGDCSD